MKWGEEKDAMLRRLWAEGLPCSRIAERMGGECSRNAVIGRANRIGLERKNPSKPRNPVKVPVRRKSPFHFGADNDAAPPLAFTPKAAPVEPLMIEFNDLAEGQCRFAYGEQAPYLFCGHPQQAESAYCEAHHRLCWHKAPQPTPRVERRAA